MLDGHKIANEKCPILREIYGMGYDTVEENHCARKYTLINHADKIYKDITFDEWNATLVKLNYCQGISLNGDIHRWVKERDGSAELLRNLIKPD